MNLITHRHFTIVLRTRSLTRRDRSVFGWSFRIDLFCFSDRWATNLQSLSGPTLAAEFPKLHRPAKSGGLAKRTDNVHVDQAFDSGWLGLYILEDAI